MLFLLFFFPLRPAQPDVILMDVIQILYGDQVFPTRARYFLRNVFTESANTIAPTAAQCVDPNAPR